MKDDYIQSATANDSNTILSVQLQDLLTQETNTSQSSPYAPVLSVVIAIIPVIITVACIVGNSAIIFVVFKVRKLRLKIENLLIVSLAISDLLVGIFVMPLSIVYEVNGEWPLGAEACSMWVTFDVKLCTASILNLMMIAIDRYLIITRSYNYQSKRTVKRMVVYIMIAWGVSAVISVTPMIVGWNAIYKEGLCTINQEIGYQLYATIAAFYAPLVVMLGLYGKVCCISTKVAKDEARRRPTMYIAMDDVKLEGGLLTNSKHDKSSTVESCLSYLDTEQTSSQNSNEDGLNEPCNNNNTTNGVCNKNGHNGDNDRRSVKTGKANSKSNRNRSSGKPKLHADRRGTRSSKGDVSGQAIVTLGVIMGSFCLCWLPFFILALVRSLCPHCFIPNGLTRALTWLGYMNSSLNPLIYARFNREFRIPLKEIICCRWGTVLQSVREDDYISRYGPCDNNTS